MSSIAGNIVKIFYFPIGILLITFLMVNILSLGKFDQSLRGAYDASEKVAYFNGQFMAVNPVFLAQTNQVLSATSGEKTIDVNLTNQTLTAYEPDGSVFMTVPVSTGLWAPTPTGDFRIWIKLRYTKMSGGSKEDNTYYYLPNVPCTQFFYKGYGLHGTYWHNNFGHPMSHGCVNMYTPDACRLFEWTSPYIPPDKNETRPSDQQQGTLVSVHY